MTEFALIRCNARDTHDGWTSEMNDHTHVDDPKVAAVLAAAAAPAEGPVPGEAAALTVFRSMHRSHGRFRMSRYSDKAKLIAAAVFGGVVVISGAATAATGGLPLVSHGHSQPHPSTSQTPSSDDQNGDTGTTTTDTPDTNGNGSSISQLAHQTPPPGETRGQMVCTQASNGQCKAGQDNGQSTATTHGKAHQNTNSASHRQNTATTHGQAGATSHGKAHQNTNSASHRQNTATTHGKASSAQGHATTSGS